jgi:hypothetical protein
MPLNPKDLNTTILWISYKDLNKRSFTVHNTTLYYRLKMTRM